jgi:hypothetical protein
MMDMTGLSIGMLGAGLVCLVAIVFIVLGIAAFIKYLRS